jgi:hypothetical protein
VSIIFFSTYSSWLKSLIMTNVGSVGEKCLQKPHNVSLSPFPIVTTHFNASKMFHSTSLPSPKLSLFFQNIRSGLDVNNSM